LGCWVSANCPLYDYIVNPLSICRDGKRLLF
jgi:hypothetical protein